MPYLKAKEVYKKLADSDVEKINFFYPYITDEFEIDELEFRPLSAVHDAVESLLFKDIDFRVKYGDHDSNTESSGNTALNQLPSRDNHFAAVKLGRLYIQSRREGTVGHRGFSSTVELINITSKQKKIMLNLFNNRYPKISVDQIIPFSVTSQYNQSSCFLLNPCQVAKEQRQKIKTITHRVRNVLRDIAFAERDIPFADLRIALSNFLELVQQLMHPLTEPPTQKTTEENVKLLAENITAHYYAQCCIDSADIMHIFLQAGYNVANPFPLPDIPMLVDTFVDHAKYQLKTLLPMREQALVNIIECVNQQPPKQECSSKPYKS